MSVPPVPPTETITISDNESDIDDNEVQYLSAGSVADHFGGESLCERAIIHKRNQWDEQSVPLRHFNEDYISHRCKQETDRNGFQYESDSYVQSVLELKNDLSSGSHTEDESDNDDIEELLGETTDSDLKLKWTPKVLLKPSEELDESIDDYDFRSALDWDKSNSSCLSFNSLPIQPSDTYQKAFYFNKSFLERLKRLECKDVTLELHLWPSIAKKFSVACISGPKTGKTTSYLVPLMNMFDTHDRSPDETQIGSIVICSSTRQTYLIAQLAKLWRDPKVPQMEHKIRIVSLNTTNETKQMTAILNGCDILISTPEPLLRGINAKLIDCVHTKALIIDEADITVTVHKKTIRDIYLAYADMKKQIKPHIISNRVVYNPMAFQTMIFAERWTPDVQWFVKEIQHMPNIVFGSYYEASIALKTNCNVRVIDSEEDRESNIGSIVKELIDSAQHMPRIGIVCRDQNEINYLKRQMRSYINGMNPLIVTHQTPHYDLERRRQMWKKSGGILLINEEAIKIVDGFQSCEFVIHYKLPKNFDNTFGDRFRLMRGVMKKYRNPMEVLTKKERKLKTFIVISPQESDVIPKVFDYLFRLKEQIPDQFLSLYGYDRLPLCHRFASYANCPLESSICAQRHSFTTSDQSLPDLPINGQIKLIISYIKGTNEFYFRIKAFRNESHSSGEWQNVKLNYQDIQKQLNEFKDNSLNTVNNPSTEETYGIAVRGQVQRVRLTQVRPGDGPKHYEAYDPNDKSEIVELFSVDYGHKITSHMRQLFKLPEHLKSLPPFAHRAYLFGIRPLDNEIDWDSRSSQRLYDLVENYRVVELTAWVLKQLGGIFWLNRLHVSKRLTNTRLKVDSNPIRYLIENKYVARNEHKLPNANTDFDRIINIWHNHRLTSSAFQTCLVDDSTYVVVSDFVSVDHFYVIQEDRVSRLQRLEEKWSSLESMEPIKEVAIDQICFYKYIDCQYGETSMNRAKVMAIDDDHVNVFLLDHGEFVNKVHKSCLYRIHESNLKELPFQAIKVGLFGVRPLKPITHDLICDLTRDDSDRYRICIADKVSYADGVHKVRLYVSDNEYETHFTCLSKLLVDTGCAEYIDGEEDNELELNVNKDVPEREEQSNDYIEYLEKSMVDNMSKNVFRGILGQLDLPMDQICDNEFNVKPETNAAPLELKPITKPIAGPSLPPNPQMNGISSAVTKPESRVAKTLRRVRAIEANKAKNKDNEDSDSEDETPQPQPIVPYTAGEFDYNPAWTEPMWFDPNDHLDDNCDHTDEEGALEEEEMS